ncbi:hypothetical protein FE257_009575 [Aspergillus nanangensis]|uniref:Uncharacterized protein n=1 Tax=Aspergillus nanangensis TaxID=2582783 RepID=A0AAD4CJM9_ASPNN|nr:hypothetical protein FE257_009575 [Aspergillus nanangensis]
MTERRSIIPSWLWKREPDVCPVRLLGTDAGKTTLIAQFFQQEPIATRPTIGINFELIPIPSEGLDLHVWEIGGGCSLVPPMMFKHLSGPDVICIFLIDKTAPERGDEAIDGLEYAFSHMEAKHFLVVFNNFAGRKPQESESQKLVLKTIHAVDKIRASNSHQNTQYEVYDDLDQFNTATGAQVDILLKRIAHIARTKKNRATTKQVVPAHASPPKPSTDDLRKIISDSAADPIHQLPPEEFMRQCVTGTLEKWDHRCHLRAGFLTLRESIAEDHVVFAASDLFLARLDAMRNANPSKFRKTSHRTLTTFWLYQIYQCMLAFRETHASLPTANQFNTLLEHHPDLMDGRAWTEFWTKEILFSPAAQAGWILPDVKPLPQLFLLSQGNGTGNAKRTTQSQHQHAKAKATTGIYQKFAYAILRAVESTHQRRAALINESLPMIQSYIMHLRAQSSSPTTVLLEPYSETQAYFWIQMLHAAMKPTLEVNPSITRLSFASFRALCPDLLAAEDAWEEFYAADTWNSIEARMKTLLPTKKPLPNVVLAPEVGQVYAVVSAKLDEKYAGRRGGGGQWGGEDDDDSVELFLRAQWMAKGGVGDTDGPTTTTTTTATSSHADLIQRLFDCVVTSRIGQQTGHHHQGAGALSQVFWDEMPFPGEGRYTSVAFWSQMVLRAFYSMDARFHDQVARLEDMGEQGQLLTQFLRANEELCWEGLWQVYYSEEKWRSHEASEGYVWPDRRWISGGLSLVD